MRTGYRYPEHKCILQTLSLFPSQKILARIVACNGGSCENTLKMPDGLPKWVRGWHSGESARLPPMWPGFDSRSRRHMWVEFVVGSRPCSEGFSPGTPVFLPSQKPTFPNSNSIWKQWREEPLR